MNPHHFIIHSLFVLHCQEAVILEILNLEFRGPQMLNSEDFCDLLSSSSTGHHQVQYWTDGIHPQLFLSLVLISKSKTWHLTQHVTDCLSVSMRMLLFAVLEWPQRAATFAVAKSCQSSGCMSSFQVKLLV